MTAAAKTRAQVPGPRRIPDTCVFLLRVEPLEFLKVRSSHQSRCSGQKCLGSCIDRPGTYVLFGPAGIRSGLRVRAELESGVRAGLLGPIVAFLAEFILAFAEAGEVQPVNESEPAAAA